ncbi:PilZ domain-containing protein [Rhodopseudomonas sp. HC1]|uniref:PilZ domain-containing protein n=1 Tax=Rhodopseudomonas infernalis TaxID=2897386 RepID=UPI001EE86531|nr:PilZ domain-containing protein [Rhodopseudomonas infernalis]MCG6206249.1 PilZ domain-containing protein [Rhodopseudomonas infernalis]
MSEETVGTDRVAFGRGYPVWIMGIDGTWRRSCVLKSVSNSEAELELEGSIEGLNLKEFFLLLSSTGLAYRRCELIRVNGSEINVRFLQTKSRSGRPMSRDDRAS